MKTYKSISHLMLTLFLFGCVHSSSVNASKTPNEDPLIKVNRKIYIFNKAIDAMYIRPVSKIYSTTVPNTIQNNIGNFFNNFSDVPGSMNQALQGKFKKATINLMRVIINSTFGILGIFDVATPMGFEKSRADFGQTLMRYGYKQSAYIVLPVFGPSTIRDTVGIAGNTIMSPQYYFKPKERNMYFASKMIHNRAHMQDVVDVINSAGVDEYILVRNAYLQRRQYLNNNEEQPMDTDDLLNGPPD